MIEQGYATYPAWKSWTAENFGKCGPADAAYFAAELRRAGVSSLRQKRVLELGFGNGAFASWAKSEGADYAGTEIIPDLQALARQAGFNVLDAATPFLNQLGAATIDIAVALDVLEHIEQQRVLEILTDLKDCLRPGGQVIGRIPSGDSPFARAVQNGDLTHKCVLGSSALRQLAVAAGFSGVVTREPVLPLRGAGCVGACRKILVKLARRLTFPVISRVFMGGGDPVLSPNMLFVLKRT